MPDVSIVVLFSGDAPMAERCLRALSAAADPGDDAELVAVLAAAGEETRAVLRALAPSARVIESPVNTGTNAGWNLAFDAAQGRHVALLHEDAEPTPGWLRPLLDTASAHPRAALVGTRLLRTDGGLWAQGVQIWEDGWPTQLTAERWPAGLEAAEPYHVDSAPSAAALFSREAWLDVGGFDERFFPAMFTETDFSIAAWLRGWTVLVEPRSLVVHDGGAMVRAERGVGGERYREFLWRRAHGRLTAKWGELLRHFGPLPPGGTAHTMTTPDFARALAHTAQRAATRPAPTGLPLQRRALTAPGGSPRGLDPGTVTRLGRAQRDVEREFAEWLDDRLAQAESDLEWMTGRRDAALAERDETR